MRNKSLLIVVYVYKIYELCGVFKIEIHVKNISWNRFLYYLFKYDFNNYSN